MARYRRRGRMSGREGAAAVVAGVVLAATVAHTAVPALTSAAVPADCATSALACGQQMAAARGWTGQQWACLDQLWARESNWSAYAANPSSTARGIPQDINGWADFAPGDVPNQVRWGLGYIAGRYITPCRAWNHETADGWY